VQNAFAMDACCTPACPASASRSAMHCVIEVAVPAQRRLAHEALVELDEILDRGHAAELRADAEILRGQLPISQGRCGQAVDIWKWALRGSRVGIRRVRR
jgi:hypothetical protein